MEKFSEIYLPYLAAKECGIAPSTLHSAIKRGDVPTLTIGGGTIVVHLADVQHYLATTPGRGRKKSTAVE